MLYANIRLARGACEDYATATGMVVALSIGEEHPTGSWITSSSSFPSVEEARAHAEAAGVPSDRIFVH
jgi:hypothetical protein